MGVGTSMQCWWRDWRFRVWGKALEKYLDPLQEAPLLIFKIHWVYCMTSYTKKRVGTGAPIAQQKWYKIIYSP